MVLMTGELVGEIPAVTGIGFQRLTEYDFGETRVIRESRIEIIDAMSDGLGDHLRNGGGIDGLAICLKRKAHGSETKFGQSEAFEIRVYHSFSRKCFAESQL